MIININGRLLPADTAGVAHDNRAFRYGYGLFETLLFKEGSIELEQLHWNRLFSGMRQLYFEVPRHFTPHYLSEELKRTVRKNKMEALCRVRLQVWPDNGGMYDGAPLAPRFLVECFPLQQTLTELNGNGLTTGIATGLAKSMDSLSALKSCNSLIYALAAKQARLNRWNDSFICNTLGHIIETSIANVFWIKNDLIYTPPVAEGCVDGVMRHHLIQVLNAKNISVLEQPLKIEDIGSVDELFLTNSIRKIKWVKQLGRFTYRLDWCRQLSGWI